jgi:uncharacterized membrane protein
MKRFSITNFLLKPLLVFSLILALVFAQTDGALAAGAGGRIGGGSFRAAPSRTYAPSRPYTPPSGGYYPGGGYGAPFIIPIFGVGGFGGLFAILLFMSVAGFLVRSFRQVQDVDALGYDSGYGTPDVAIAQVQVGLLSSARSLQADLNRIALNADTGSSAGLAQVLQETSLSLLRHPEYWVYGGSESAQVNLPVAETQFNRLALTERSKFSKETLSNYNNQLTQSATAGSLSAAETNDTSLAAPLGEYIVVTLLVATQGKLQLPDVKSSEDLRRALAQLGTVSGDRLLALEVLWTPQVDGDTLSADELVAEYPDLVRI